MEELVGNEENGYPVPDLNKTMINVFNAHKKSLKEERGSWKRSLRNL
jgi:hypothetical protein